MTKTAEVAMTETYLAKRNESPHRSTEKYSGFKSQLYDTLFAITNSVKTTRICKVGLGKTVLPGLADI